MFASGINYGGALPVHYQLETPDRQNSVGLSQTRQIRTVDVTCAINVMCTKSTSDQTPDLTCKSKNEAPHSRLHHLGTRHYVRQDGTNCDLTRAAMWAGLDEFGRQWTAWIQGASKKDSKHSAKRRRYQAMCVTNCFISPRHELSSYGSLPQSAIAMVP